MVFVILINFLLYFFTAVFSYKRIGFSLYFVLWAYYAMFAILGIVVIHTGIYKEMGNVPNYRFETI